jgi:hypothetical protein
LLSHHEDHKGRAGKFSHPLFVTFVVVRALPGLYASPQKLISGIQQLMPINRAAQAPKQVALSVSI